MRPLILTGVAVFVLVLILTSPVSKNLNLPWLFPILVGTGACARWLARRIQLQPIPRRARWLWGFLCSIVGTFLGLLAYNHVPGHLTPSAWNRTLLDSWALVGQAEAEQKAFNAMSNAFSETWSDADLGLESLRVDANHLEATARFERYKALAAVDRAASNPVGLARARAALRLFAVLLPMAVIACALLRRPTTAAPPPSQGFGIWNPRAATLTGSASLLSLVLLVATRTSEHPQPAIDDPNITRASLSWKPLARRDRTLELEIVADVVKSPVELRLEHNTLFRANTDPGSFPASIIDTRLFPSGPHRWRVAVEFPSEAAAAETHRSLAAGDLGPVGSGAWDVFHIISSDGSEHTLSLQLHTSVYPRIQSDRAWLTSTSRRQSSTNAPSLEIAWRIHTQDQAFLLYPSVNTNAAESLAWSERTGRPEVEVRYLLLPHGTNQSLLERRFGASRQTDTLNLPYEEAVRRLLSTAQWGIEASYDTDIRLAHIRETPDFIQIVPFPPMIPVGGMPFWTPNDNLPAPSEPETP